MRIAINGLVLGRENKGIGNYIIHITNALVRCEEHDVYVFVKNIEMNQFFDSSVHVIEVTNANDSKYLKIWGEQVLIPKIMKKNKIDILLNPAYTGPFFTKKPLFS